MQLVKSQNLLGWAAEINAKIMFSIMTTLGLYYDTKDNWINGVTLCIMTLNVMLCWLYHFVLFHCAGWLILLKVQGWGSDGCDFNFRGHPRHPYRLVLATLNTQMNPKIIRRGVIWRTGPRPLFEASKECGVARWIKGKILFDFPSDNS